MPRKAVFSNQSGAVHLVFIGGVAAALLGGGCDTGDHSSVEVGLSSVGATVSDDKSGPETHDSLDTPSSDGTPPRSGGSAWRDELRQSIADQRWESVESLARRLMTADPEDSEAFAAMAIASGKRGDVQSAIDWFLEAVRLEGYRRGDWNQSVLVLAHRGNRFYDAADLLRALVDRDLATPIQTRALADLYIELELRAEHQALFRSMVRKRQMDLPLLMDGLATDRRTTIPLGETTRIVEAYPHDLRPLVAKARDEFDFDRLDSAESMVMRILDRHPGDVPALCLRGRIHARRRDQVRTADWLVNAGDRLVSQADYWWILAEYLARQNRADDAQAAYAKALTIEPFRVDAIAGLRDVMVSRSTTPDPMVDQLAHRLDHLTAMRDTVREIRDVKKLKSQRLVARVASELIELRRYWEAEAWAAVATTIPQEPDPSTRDIRRRAIESLRNDTPWWPDTPLDRQLAALAASIPLTDVLIARDSPLPESAVPRRTVAEAASVRLENEAADRGLDFFGFTDANLDQPGVRLYKTLGCGVGVIDFDRDGWSDVCMAAAGGRPRQRDSFPGALFRNQDGAFDDVSQPSTFADVGFSQGVCVGDYNADGFEDVFICNLGRNTLLQNNGDGSFVDVTDRVGLGDSAGWSTSAAWVDLSSDGLSDLYVLNYCDGDEFITRGCWGKSGKREFSCRPTEFPAAADQVYQLTPRGRFERRDRAWGVSACPPARGLGIIAGSLDADEGMDLFIANDMTANHYWTAKPLADRTEDTPLLGESAVTQGLAVDDRSSAQACMGIAVADFDGDRSTDLYVTNYMDEPNTLYAQLNPGRWDDITVTTGMSQDSYPFVGFGAQAVDLDLNGSPEIAVANGHIDRFADDIPYAQPAQLFGFERGGAAECWSGSVFGRYGDRPHVGRAMAVIDANRDGRQDLLVTHQTEPVALLVNQTETSSHWVAFEVRGVEASVDAVGATLTVQTASNQIRVPVLAGHGYLATNSSTVVVGLGDEDRVDSVTVQWPSIGGRPAKRQTHHALAIDRTHLLVEGCGQTFPLPARSGR